MEDGNIVFVWEPPARRHELLLVSDVFWVSASFEQKYGTTRLCKACSQCSPARAGADDYVFDTLTLYLPARQGPLSRLCSCT